MNNKKIKQSGFVFFFNHNCHHITVKLLGKEFRELLNSDLALIWL